MSRLPNCNCKAEADRSSLQNDGTTTYISNVTTAPTHTLSGRDPDESLLTDTLGVAEGCKVPVASPIYGKRCPEIQFLPSLLIYLNFDSIL